MEKLSKLRGYNLIMGIFHLVQACLMLYLSSDFKLPIYSNYLMFDAVTQRLVPDPQILFELPIGPLVAAFLFLSALAHFIISSPGVYDWYQNNLKQGINYARWYEYALSSSVMIVIIAMLAGVYEVSSLLQMFALNAMMIFFGLMMELHNQTTKMTNWTSYIFGCIAGIVPWIVIALYLFNAGDGENRAPDFVYWIFFSIFLFFNVFAINMILQYKKIGKWKEYVFGEKVYILMSLVAKSLLAWQVFAGTLRPE